MAGAPRGEDPRGEEHVRREVTRAKVRARLERTLAGGCSSAAGAVDAARLARRLESSLWNWTLSTCQRDRIPLYWDNARVRFRYTTRALSVDYNLREAPGLLARVLAGDPAPKALVRMSPQEMWPARWEEAYARKAARDLKREAAVTDPATAPDGAYTCSWCKSRKTVYTSLQTRSADEPMTNFVRCLGCNKSWKD